MNEYQRAYRKSPKGRKIFAAYKKRYYGRTAFAENHKQRWADWEDRLVMERSVTDRELADKLGRSVAAIQHRRCRLMKGGEL